jgi:hypothetical protein
MFDKARQRLLLQIGSINADATGECPFEVATPFRCNHAITITGSGARKRMTPPV